MKERIHYIDVAKGILIVLVVFDNTTDFAISTYNTHDGVMSAIDYCQWTYKCFFMPAFFILTGFCSNFTRPFLKELTTDIRTIVVPSILFSVLLQIIFGHFDTLPHFLLYDIVLHGGPGAYWFLSALFLSKLIYWCLYNTIYNKQYYRLAILIILTFMGVAIRNIPYNYDLWNIHYALSLVIFLEIGQILKKRMTDKILNYASLGFVIIVLLHIFTNHQIHGVARYFDFNLLYTPVFLISAVVGSLALINIAKRIDSCAVLEYLGRESLILYIFQFAIIKRLEYAISLVWFPNSIFEIIAYLLIVLIITVALCSAIAALIETKYLKWSIGR